MNISRTLFIAVILLIIVILGELVYLFYKPPVQDKELVTNNNQITTVPLERAPNAAITQDKIDALSRLDIFKEGVLQKAVLSYQVGGEITEIQTTTRQNDSGNNVSVKSIQVVGSKGFNNTFFFPVETDLAIEIKEQTPEGEKNITLDDLQNGDKINIQYNINLLEDLNYDKNIQKIIINKE